MHYRLGLPNILGQMTTILLLKVEKYCNTNEGIDYIPIYFFDFQKAVWLHYVQCIVFCDQTGIAQKSSPSIHCTYLKLRKDPGIKTCMNNSNQSYYRVLKYGECWLVKAQNSLNLVLSKLINVTRC